MSRPSRLPSSHTARAARLPVAHESQVSRERSRSQFTESHAESFETLARRSVSQANHDLADRVQPN